MTFGCLRVKNESRWIKRAIESIQPLCGVILVYDDGSTDDTVDICLSLGCRIVRASAGNGAKMDEPTAKDWLLATLWRMAGACIGDTVIWIDGDESLCPEDIPNLRDAIDYGVEAAAFRVVYLWNDEQTVRMDGIYYGFTRPSMFRLTSRDLSFMKTGGAGFHCSNVPQQLIAKAAPLPVRLLHYGYMERPDRVRKYCWYNEKEWVHSGLPLPQYTDTATFAGFPSSDQAAVWGEAYGRRGRVPDSLRLEDGYRHMLIGDYFPAESRFCHGGPLKLTPLAELRNSGRWYPQVEGHYDARTSTFDPPEMAGVLEHHDVLLNNRPVRWAWYFDTREGIVKTYDPQPEYRCGRCGVGMVEKRPGPDGESSALVHEDDSAAVGGCPGALIEVAQHEVMEGPLIVSEDSWTLRGKVEIVRRKGAVRQPWKTTA